MSTSNLEIDIENPSSAIESSGTGKKFGIALLALVVILCVIALILWKTNTWPFNLDLTYSCSGSSCIEDENGIYSASNCSNKCIKEPECTINSDCDDDYKCINNECVINSSEEECSENSDCDDDYKCINNECVINSSGEGFTINMNNNELINGLDGEFYKMINQNTCNYNK